MRTISTHSLIVVVFLFAASVQAEPPPPRLDLLGDPLPSGAIARYGTTRLRHAGQIRGLAFSPDGKSIASLCPEDNSVRIWDVTTGQQIARTPIVKWTIDRQALKTAAEWSGIRGTGVFFLPDGRVCFVGGRTAATIWDYRKSERWEVGDSYEFTTVSLAGALAPDGKSIAIGFEFGATSVFNLATGEELAKLESGKGPVVHLSFSPNGQLLAATYYNCETILWDLKKKSSIRSYSPGGGPWGPMTSQFSPDGKSLALVINQSIKLFDTASNKELSKFDNQTTGVALVRFTSDGKKLVGIARDGRICSWDSQSGKSLMFGGKAILSSGSGEVYGSFDAAGATAAVCSGPDIHLFDIATSRPKHEFVADRPSFSQVVLSTGGSVRCVDSDGTVHDWDPSTGKPKRIIRLRETALDVWASAELSPDGRRVAILAMNEPLRVWSINDRKAIWKYELDDESVGSTAFSPDGKCLALALTNDLVIWNVELGKQSLMLPRSKRQLAWSPEGRTLAAFGDTDGISLFELATGGLRRTWEAADIRSMAFSADGKHLASGDENGVIRVFAMNRDQPVLDMVAASQPINVVRFSPDGKTLFAAIGNHIRVWDRDGRPLAVFREHQGSITDLTTTADGRFLISASADGTALVWDLRQQEREPIQMEVKLEQCWLDLGSLDAAKAFAAVHSLRDDPGKTLPFVAERLKPTRMPDAGKIDALINDLGSANFSERRSAMKALEMLDVMAQKQIQSPLKTSDFLPAEALAALRRLVQKMDAPPTNPDRLREVRAIETLEIIGSKQAKALLEKLAAGDDSRLTREAKAALSRWKN